MKIFLAFPDPENNHQIIPNTGLSCFIFHRYCSSTPCPQVCGNYVEQFISAIFANSICLLHVSVTFCNSCNVSNLFIIIFVTVICNQCNQIWCYYQIVLGCHQLYHYDSKLKSIHVFWLLHHVAVPPLFSLLRPPYSETQYWNEAN